MKAPGAIDKRNTRTGPLAASALLIGAAFCFSVAANAQQGLPQAQPLDQLPTAERRQQQQPQAQQQGQQGQSQQTQQRAQQGQQQSQQTQQSSQQTQQQTSVNPRAKNGPQGMYETRVDDLQDTVVVDMAGASIGYVQDIVVKQDNSEAGLVIFDGQEQVYVPLTEVRLEGEQFLLTSKIDPAPVSERELRDRNFNVIPDTDRPLSDYIQPRQQGGSR
ncbi:hypothetical protein F6455_14160 [Proteobacteria bacterium 005FR1]|nr:hypothetical protein [Proteobacteria bacterium 005FR1]